jgi:hypothetical protein
VHLRGNLLGAPEEPKQPETKPAETDWRSLLPKPKLRTNLFGEPVYPVPPNLLRELPKPSSTANSAPADGPGLLGPSKPLQYPNAVMRPEDWKNLEIYKAEVLQKQQAFAQQMPMPTEEPRQIDPGKRGVISTNPENPAYPDRGNFADKLWGPRRSHPCWNGGRGTRMVCLEIARGYEKGK